MPRDRDFTGICDIILQMYEAIVKPLLFKFDPEIVHELAVATGERLGRFRITRSMIGALYNYRGPTIAKIVDGLSYRTPFVLSAGFDYNGRLSQILPMIGLGGEEVGSVTARPCVGNPRPRLTRLPRSRSIIVNKGLRNDGVEVIARRLKSRSRISNFVVGVSIARTNDAASATVENGINDYCFSLSHLIQSEVGDYYTLNISCPNAFGGESFATPELLPRLLTAVRQIDCPKPIYVKMPINKPWSELSSLIQIVIEHGLSGIIIGNLNKNYADLKFRTEAPVSYCGGLSGDPCRQPSTNLIRLAREKFGRQLTIIGCGGVMSVEAANEKFLAGTDLIHLITGLIYRGPGLVKELASGYRQ